MKSFVRCGSCWLDISCFMATLHSCSCGTGRSLDAAIGQSLLVITSVCVMCVMNNDDIYSYLTTTEWSSFYGGKKATAEVGQKSKFRRMPFFCCR